MEKVWNDEEEEKCWKENDQGLAGVKNKAYDFERSEYEILKTSRLVWI